MVDHRARAAPLAFGLINFIRALDGLALGRLAISENTKSVFRTRNGTLISELLLQKRFINDLLAGYSLRAPRAVRLHSLLAGAAKTIKLLCAKDLETRARDYGSLYAAARACGRAKCFRGFESDRRAAGIGSELRKGSRRSDCI
jgi:hypothetical protein